ncbi:ABC transporter [Bacteriovorax stolpii]|uniref:Cell division ATP-binding protein FtsE n=1 Tax=Bacteriovorax stolpii TaxID=960 RepID=A0A2K9NUR2_BACTC|nr:ATP-binding cassette domain-containing protein [Bacteriovorax stolpii]AUN99238.1 ABC transporter [Bacteriovorax stolpii]TDP55222.1 D-methionine transport system ATP-binding protein [Bacteriovorax stolpii]
MIVVDSVSKTYSAKHGATKALDNISFNVKSGEVYGLIGLSGAGKSTALRTLNLLEVPTSGHIFLEGVDLVKKNAGELRLVRQKVGMIFQHFNLLANRTVADNVALPLEIAGWKKSDIEKRVLECLDLVGLREKKDAYPALLSGGQKQRVAIARSIANHPKVLLADEPTSALDPLTKGEILDCLIDLNKKLNLTIVIATHEMTVVKRLCHRVSLFKDGKIQETLEVKNGLISPETEYGKALVRDF